MRTPSSGRKITNTVHPALPHPDTSGRRKMSERTMINSHTQITHAKKTNIVHMMSRNGYDEASVIRGHLSREECDDYAAGVETPASSNRGGKASRRSTWLGRRNTTSSSCSAVTSEMSLTPRSRNQSQIPMTESSGVEAPDVTPTASQPRNMHSSSARSSSTSQ